jgi:hypothetical protein
MFLIEKKTDDERLHGRVRLGRGRDITRILKY